MAAIVFSLAEKTGWGIDYILWEIPISILHQASHTFMWLSGVRVRMKASMNQDEARDIAKLIGL
jgi:hypothetical protein